MANENPSFTVETVTGNQEFDTYIAYINYFHEWLVDQNKDIYIQFGYNTAAHNEITDEISKISGGGSSGSGVLSYYVDNENDLVLTIDASNSEQNTNE